MELFYTEILCCDGQTRVVEAGSSVKMDNLLETLLPYIELKKWTKEIDQEEYEKILKEQNKDRMLDLEILWEDFDLLPIDENDQVLYNFEHFPKGTKKQTIIDWFDTNYIGGLKKLLEELEN